MRARAARHQKKEDSKTTTTTKKKRATLVAGLEGAIAIQVRLDFAWSTQLRLVRAYKKMFEHEKCP